MLRREAIRREAWRREWHRERERREIWREYHRRMDYEMTAPTVTFTWDV